MCCGLCCCSHFTRFVRSGSWSSSWTTTCFSVGSLAWAWTNRNGLIAAAMVTQADGYAEREAALLMLADKQEGRSRRITVGADKAYDAEDFVKAARALNVTPHIAKNDKGRGSNMDGRTTRHEGYSIS